MRHMTADQLSLVIGEVFKQGILLQFLFLLNANSAICKTFEDLAIQEKKSPNLVEE